LVPSSVPWDAAPEGAEDAGVVLLAAALVPPLLALLAPPPLLLLLQADASNRPATTTPERVLRRTDRPRMFLMLSP
jgi:hypothetical protein